MSNPAVNEAHIAATRAGTMHLQQSTDTWVTSATQGTCVGQVNHIVDCGGALPNGCLDLSVVHGKTVANKHPDLSVS